MNSQEYNDIAKRIVAYKPPQPNWYARLVGWIFELLGKHLESTAAMAMTRTIKKAKKMGLRPVTEAELIAFEKKGREDAAWRMDILMTPCGPITYH